MKINLADVLTTLVMVAIIAGAFFGLKSCDNEERQKVQACVDNPIRETCQPCADSSAKRADVCSSILAGIILEEKKK
jgi:hypothetical protein